MEDLSSTPEVRPLPSAVVTRFSGRLRLPFGTMGLSDSPRARHLTRRLPAHLRRRPLGPLTLRRGPSARAVAITPAAGSVSPVITTDPQRSSPIRWRLDAASELSRPARHSLRRASPPLALRPMRLLPRLKPGFARSFDPANCSAGPSRLLPRRTDNSSDGSPIRWSSAPSRDAQRTQFLLPPSSSFRVRRWMLDVQCSVFDVLSSMFDVRRSILSPSPIFPPFPQTRHIPTKPDTPRRFPRPRQPPPNCFPPLLGYHRQTPCVSGF